MWMVEVEHLPNTANTHLKAHKQTYGIFYQHVTTTRSLKKKICGLDFVCITMACILGMAHFIMMNVRSKTLKHPKDLFKGEVSW